MLRSIAAFFYGLAGFLLWPVGFVVKADDAAGDARWLAGLRTIGVIRWRGACRDASVQFRVIEPALLILACFG